MIELNFIVCIDSKGGISKDGKIPWKITEDTTYFRDTITRKFNGKPNIIICGKKTFESMGSVKNHHTIVLSKTIENTLDDVTIISSLNMTIEYLTHNYNKYGKVFVCGGKKVYDDFFELAHLQPHKFSAVFYANIINADYNCDNHIDMNMSNIIIQQYCGFNHILNVNNKINFGVELCVNDINHNKKVKLIILKPFYINGNLIKSNYEEIKYLEIMKNILNAPKKTGRNGVTRSLFGEQLKFKLNSFPLLTSKRVYFKGVFEELMFFIRGDTNSKHLSEKNVKIWEPNTTKEFIMQQNLNYEEGDMGPMYGFQWRHFNAPYHGMHSKYDNKGFDQLKYIMEELKSNPSSRRLIMSTYNPVQASEGVLFPCHGIGIVFNTSEVENDRTENTLYLNVMQLQRSCDYFLGVPFNIASYSLLVYMLCEVLNNDINCKYNFVPGELTMSLGDYHLYESHINEATRQLVRTPTHFPSLHFKNKIYNMEDFTFEDIEIVDYNPCNEIKATMVS
jgi:dihydrofolate reductase/thymidylate synthase